MGQWPGVFPEGERIDLEPDHLKVCGSFLEDIKLFNSNLQVIDEAFEYLSIKAAKGEKGQYFTPRHVIDMCVRMLNPSLDDYVVDTAAGSCGFTVHSIFHVWGDVFTAKGPEKWQSVPSWLAPVLGFGVTPRICSSRGHPEQAWSALDCDTLHFIKTDVVVAPVVEAGGA